LLLPTQYLNREKTYITERKEKERPYIKRKKRERAHEKEKRQRERMRVKEKRHCANLSRKYEKKKPPEREERANKIKHRGERKRI
jgi:hypothetical protein